MARFACPRCGADFTEVGFDQMVVARYVVDEAGVARFVRNTDEFINDSCCPVCHEEFDSNSIGVSFY